jgi:ribonuclease T2
MKYFIGLCILAGLSVQPVAAEYNLVEKKPFDYYMMSLSWSPEFCATHQNNKQCGRGYGLVLHGLWPQYAKGHPESCSSERIPARLVHEFNGLYPAEGLAFHEWQKHGTCSGLPPREYLQFSQKLRGSFITPAILQNLAQPLRITAPALTRQVLAANPKLNAEAIAFDCAEGGRFLQEVYVCFDKSGRSAVACGADVQRRSQHSCGQADFLVRNLR